jgi:hypothetical protein
MELSEAKRRFSNHKSNAKRRGIGFELTFEQWMQVWGDKLDRMGTGRDQYGMCRAMDSGPYAVDNVFIGSPKRNAHTRSIVRFGERMRCAQAANFSKASYDDDAPEEDNPWLPDELKGSIRNYTSQAGMK